MLSVLNTHTHTHAYTHKKNRRIKGSRRKLLEVMDMFINLMVMIVSQFRGISPNSSHCIH